MAENDRLTLTESTVLASQPQEVALQGGDIRRSRGRGTKGEKMVKLADS